MAKIRGSVGGKPGGTGLKGSKWEYKQSKQVAIKNMDEDIKAFMHTLIGVGNPTSFYALATKHISLRLIAIMADVLKGAVDRAPYESGELRESGEVTVIAGQASGMDTFVKVARGSGASENPEIVILKNYISKPSTTIQMEISFDREEKGMDLALWAHEELLRYVKRPKSGAQIGRWYARKLGTGPKYLENAFKEHKANIPREIQKGLLDAIKAYNSRHGTRARRRG